MTEERSCDALGDGIGLSNVDELACSYFRRQRSPEAHERAAKARALAWRFRARGAGACHRPNRFPSRGFSGGDDSSPRRFGLPARPDGRRRRRPAGNGVGPSAPSAASAPTSSASTCHAGAHRFEWPRRLVDSGASSHIIFVTAYDHSDRASSERVDYLLKPSSRRGSRWPSIARGGASRPPALPRARLTPPSSDNRMTMYTSSWPNGRAGSERLRQVGERFLLVQAAGHYLCRLADEGSASLRSSTRARRTTGASTSCTSAHRPSSCGKPLARLDINKIKGS